MMKIIEEMRREKKTTEKAEYEAQSKKGKTVRMEEEGRGKREERRAGAMDTDPGALQ